MKKTIISFLLLGTASLAVASTLSLPLSYNPSADECGHVLITDFENFDLGQELDTTMVNGSSAFSAIVATDTLDVHGRSAMLKNGSSAQIRYIKLNVTLPVGKTIADYLYLEYDFKKKATSNQVFSVRLDKALIYNESTTMSPSPANNQWYHRMIPLVGLTSGNTFVLEIGLSSAVYYFLDNIRLISKNNSFKVDDFEDKALDTPYTTTNGDNCTAMVKADPWGLPISGAAKSAHCLEVVTKGALYPVLPVALPEGKKLSDYSEVVFSIYCAASNFGNGLRIYANSSSNVLGNEPNSAAFNANKCWITRKYDLSNVDTAIGDLTSFNMQIGANAGSAINPFTYYINNIYLIAKDAISTSINPVEELNAQVFGGKGVIEVIPEGEQTVKICGIDGLVKFNAKITTSTSISLPQGVYLIQIGEQVIKRIVE